MECLITGGESGPVGVAITGARGWYGGADTGADRTIFYISISSGENCPIFISKNRKALSLFFYLIVVSSREWL